MPAPGPARNVPLLQSVASVFRVGPSGGVRLKSANPGLDLMAEVELIRRDLIAHLPADPHLKRLLVRHDALLREGEGQDAAREAEEIDAYVAEHIVRYAKLRRKELRQKGLRINSAAAFSAIEYTADRKSVAVINFAITGAGHTARASIRITIP